MTRCIGIYSGTFDPVHAGHIAFATATLQACRLDEVIFLPEKQPRRKEVVTDISHRLALLEKATENIPSLRVLELSSRQFTPEQTLQELRQLLGDAELTLLMGSDVVNHLLSWPNVTALLGEASLAIGVRIGDSQQEASRILQTADLPLSPTFIHTSLPHAASSHVRDGDMTYLIPDIAEYIDTHALYPQVSR